MTPAERLAAIAPRFGIDALYAFGSRAAEALASVDAGRAFEAGQPSDLDVAVLPLPGRALNADERVALAVALEGLFGDLAPFERARRAHAFSAGR